MSACCRCFMLVMLNAWGLAMNAPGASAAESVQWSPAETGLIAAETQRFNAQLAQDAAALKSLLADDLTYIHATGRVQGKDEYLQSMASGMRYRAIDIQDRVVHVEGNMGMTTGTITITVGNGMQLASRYTGVYIKRDQRWQLLAWQTTDIRPPGK